MRELGLRLVKTIAAGTDRLRPRRRGVVVLLYHRVGRRQALEMDLPAALFAEQMEVLAESGRLATIDDALRAAGRPTPPALDPVVVTFDDGTADFVDVAMPLIERYRIPVTLYVATDFVERGEPFPHDGRPASWAALADAVSTGLLTLGSHTHTHAVLRRMDPSSVTSELDRSKGLIQDRIGVRAVDFAYPKGVAGSPAADGLVRARFRSAAFGGTRPNPYGRTDPYRLARSPIQASDGMQWFLRKLSGGMALEETVRSAVNRWRYARATT